MQRPLRRKRLCAGHDPGGKQQEDDAPEKVPRPPDLSRDHSLPTAHGNSPESDEPGNPKIFFTLATHSARHNRLGSASATGHHPMTFHPCAHELVFHPDSPDGNQHHDSQEGQAHAIDQPRGRRERRAEALLDILENQSQHQRRGLWIQDGTQRPMRATLAPPTTLPLLPGRSGLVTLKAMGVAGLRAEFAGGAGDPPRPRREGKLELTEATRL
jgi:hypothetical protein